MALYTYINSKLKTRVSVESLHLITSTITVADQDKVDALNIFSNVFTKENTGIVYLISL